jgi:hypothetical protein
LIVGLALDQGQHLPVRGEALHPGPDGGERLVAESAQHHGRGFRLLAALDLVGPPRNSRSLKVHPVLQGWTVSPLIVTDIPTGRVPRPG